MHILIAEDDKVSMMILQANLKSMNHTFVSAYDGQELVDIFSKFPDDFDTIITDCMMPKMTGLEACREIKKIKNIDVVLLTAYDQDHIIKSNDGIIIPWTVCDYFLRKPTRKECIIEVLCNVDYDNSVRARMITA